VQLVKQLTFYLGVAAIGGAVLHFGVMGIWNQFHWAAMTGGGILILLGVILNISELAAFFRSRKALHSFNLIVATLILLVILVLVNILSVQNNRRFDTTSSQRLSLSEQTLKLLKTLDKDVSLLAFCPSSDHPNDLQTNEMVRALLREYRAISSNIHWEIIDLDRNPDRAQRYNITYYNTIAVEHGNKVELIDKIDEGRLTSAILKVTRKKNKQLIFLTGHGEKSINETQGSGISFALEALIKNNYDVGELNLAKTQEIQEECSVLIIAGPKTELFEKEIQWLEKYTGRGGALLIMVNPLPDASLEPLLIKWGVRPRKDLVLDDSQTNQLLGTSLRIPLITRYPDHPITRGMKMMAQFPMVRSLERIRPVPHGLTFQYLFRTNPDSWGEMDFQNLKPGDSPKFNPGRDLMGPLDIGLTVEGEFDLTVAADKDKKAPARLVVIGGSGFISNAFFKKQFNADLFLNTINWLATDENLIAIRPREPENVPVIITEAQYQIVFYISVIFLPLIPLLAGVIVIISRRRKK